MIFGRVAWRPASGANGYAAGGPDPRESDRENECGGMNVADAGGGCRRRLQEADAGGGCRRRMQEEEEEGRRHGIKAEPSPRGEENFETRLVAATTRSAPESGGIGPAD